MNDSKKIIIILSHCDTEEKKQVLLKNVEILKTIPNTDILLTSHITLPQDIVEEFDYFVYDKSNPILKWPQKTMVHWIDYPFDDKKIRISYFVDDYGWAVFNQINSGYSSISYKNYDNFIFMNYDLQINEGILHEINREEKYSRFYSVKGQGGHKSFPGLIFFILNKKDVEKISLLLDSDVYCKHEYAEKFLESISNVVNYKKINITTFDHIDYGSGTNGKLFNNSLSKDYSLFVGYNNPDDKNEIKFYFYNIKKDITIKNGDDVITIYEGESKLITQNEEIQILINGEFGKLPYKKYSKHQYIELK
jgi:hypothetical protein